MFMPRLARHDAPGVVHHVIIRVIERKNIFRGNNERDNLLKRIKDFSVYKGELITKENGYQLDE